MSIKLIILLSIGALTLGLLAYIAIRAWRYHRNHLKSFATLLLMLAAGQGSAWAQTFTIEASYNSSTHKTTYTISRSGSSLPEQTIKYRTVNLSAYAGQHYTAVSGTYTFPANETTKTVEVTESTPGTDAYKYQTTSQRSYRFEVLDVNGFELQHYDRTYSTGTSFSNTKVSKEITNLVTMSGSNFSSGMSSSKYLDVTYTPPTSQVETSGTLSGYVLIDDSYDYAQKPATVSTSELIGSTGATAADLNTLGYKIYATVCFTEKERDDGYQYLQIVAGNSGASYDTGADPEGAVNDPSNSLYKVCFELADGSNSEGKIYFPHRGTTVSEFSLSTGHLWQQKYKSGTSGSGTGCVILDPTVTYITTRFDAGGSNDDTWGYKDFFVRMALCDATKPTLYNNSTSGITVSAGPYIVGNTFYISVPFSEIVHISGSSKQLNTSWGPVTYETGDNTNVITFKGTINATAGTVLSITGINNCLFNDLATNYDQFNSSSFNKTFNGVTCSATYTLAVTNTAFTIPNDDYWVSDNDHLPQPHPTTFYFYKGIVNSTNQVTLAETTDYTLAWSDNTAAGTGTVTVNGAGSYTGSISTTFPIRWSTYTVSFHDNGSIGIPVTGSMSDQAFEYGVAQNLSANAFNRTGYTFAGWNTAPDGSGTAYTDGQSVSGLNPEDGAVTDLYAQWTVISWTGSGDNANDPFIILYASQLDLLASNVNAGNTFQNKFFQLADDITYSTTGLGATESNYTAIGHNSTYYFDGTFDGNNHTISGIRIHTTADEQGVFGQVGINGIVKNVVLANSTITAHIYVGGIVGYNFGTLTNCRVEGSVEVLPIDYLSVRHGGIVGQNHGTVSGCISAANVDNHGIGNVRYYGGIVGDNDSYGTVKDCLYTGSTVSALNYFGAIAGTNAGTLTNNYYTTENLGGVGNGQSNSSGNDCDGARRALSVTLDANVALNGDETEYDVSGLTALGTTALSYNDGTTTTIYSGEGQTLTFSHSGVPATGYVWSGFSATNGGTFSGNTLTMPAAAVTVSATFTPIVYNITYDLDGGSASNPDTYTIETPDFTLANPTRTGYAFAGWTGTDLSTPTSSLTIVQGSIGHRAYTAVWTPIVYNLTYDLDGGSASNPDTYTVETPDFTLANPTREGYTFLGWTGTDLSTPTSALTIVQGSLGDRSYTATWRVNIPYIDADGNLQSCTDYTLVGSSSGNVTYGTAGEEGWFVVSGDVTITGRLTLQGSSKHLILCDGATLTVTNSSNSAISSSGSGSTLSIYGQAAGTGILNASAAGYQTDAIYHAGSLFINGGHVNAQVDGSASFALEASSSITVNGGSVQATGTRGFRAGNGDITLGWRSLSDRIHAISYSANYGSVTVKAGQHLTDGTAVYSGTLTSAQLNAIAGQTLQPCFAVTLPEHVAATGVISQTGTTAYAIPGATVTLAAAGYSLTAATVGGDPATDNGDGTWSFTVPAADVTVTAVWRAPVPYIDADGNTQTCTDYTLVESSNDQNTYYYSPSGGGWYVVDGDVTLVNLSFYDNDAHLILKDGATLTFNSISTDSDVALTIYGQSLGTGTLSGEDISVERDDLTINGGTLVINTPYSRDAIQTLYNGNIVVNGGTVTATSANGNAIYSSGSLTINGGTVTATNLGNVNGSLYSRNGDITINGGIVTATAPADFYAIVAGNNGGGTNPGCRNLNLSWTDPTDRISFSSFAGNVRLMAGKAFVDEDDHLYYINGSGYNSLGYAVTGHLLTPFTDYDREFSITYHPEGGTMPASYPTTYTYNTTVALPVPTREDYVFLGWIQVGMNEPVTVLEAGSYLGDMELYADWAPLYTDVSYLDENGTQQTVRAKILYNTSTTFEGGIYTITGTTVFSAPVTFTGNTTLILPNNETLVAIPSGAVSVTVGGNLTVYGQEVGYGNMVTGGVSASGNIAIYGGMVQASGLTANGGNGTITLSWTDMANQCSAREYRGQVNLVKDFRYSFYDGTMVVVHAGTDIDTATINGKYLSPYFQTTTVHYLDENATRHTADATVLWGNETGTLPGGIYTLLDYLTFSHGLAFDGNTTLVLPDNSYLYIHDGNWEPIAGDGITVNGNLALYGQENRNGIIEILASGDAIHASGNITVSNVSADIYDGNGIRSDADILVAGGEYYSCGTIAAGTITLGYLTLYDHIYSDAYTGTVTVRTGQTLIDYNNYNTYSGTLTAAQVLGIEGASLEPYIENPVTRTVESYNGSENGGWVFLASPVMGSIRPSEVDYMTSGFYDLYRYNTGTDVWENYRRHYDDFMLYNGRGYLYARADTETLEFSGAYNMNSTQAVSLEQGFNLVGNPFDAAATIDRPCYKMNAEGNGLVACATGTSIAVCEGVMVYSAVGGQEVTFSRNASGSKGSLNFNVSNDEGRQLDNAVVTLGGTDALEKIDNFNSQFSIFNSSVSLSIPQDGHRYAVASVPEGTQAVPLAFDGPAGEYTLSTFNSQLSTLNYLHLIDRETGADVDLLRDSTYTFNSQLSTFNSTPRFLVLLSPTSAQEAQSTHFAYQEGDRLIITGSGTLEAYDVMGRKLFTQEISTFNVQLSTSAFPGAGVYVLRLAGQSQKIVIK